MLRRYHRCAKGSPLLDCISYSLGSFLLLQGPNVPYRTQRYHTAIAQTPSKFPSIHRLFVLAHLICKPLPRPIATVSPRPQFTMVPTPSSLSTPSPPICTRHAHSIKKEETYVLNSPNLCPTISSVIVTSWYTFPLCTWNFRPTKFGRIVAERCCVLMGTTFSPCA